MIRQRKARLVVPVVALLVLLAGAGAAYLWSGHHLDAARRALERYDLDEAARHLDLCLGVRFRSPGVHLLAAQTARRRQDYDRAELHLAACVRLDGMSEAAGLERLLLTAEQGDLNDVERLLKGRTQPDDPQALLVLEALARGYVNRFLLVDAALCLNLLLEREPDHPQALLMRARVWESVARNGRVEREPLALRDYEKAVALQPSFEARLGLAGTLYRVGRPSDALREYERLVRDDPGHPEVQLGLARCRWALHEVDEARRLLDDLLARHPDHPDGLLERGIQTLHEGKLAEAEKWLREAVALAPLCEYRPLRILARCLDAAGKPEEARHCRERLRQREALGLHLDCRTAQLNREPRNLAMRYQLSLDLLHFGRESDGVAGLFLVLEQDPGHTGAHTALADYFARTGQPPRAARHRRAGAAGHLRAW